MSGFTHGYEIKAEVYGTYFDKLETPYVHPKQMRNDRGRTPVKVFDEIMRKHNIKFYDGNEERFAMPYKHWAGFGWVDSDNTFYTDKVIGIDEMIFVEIKSAITDMHHPAKVLLEAQSVKVSKPNAKFFVYNHSGEWMSTAKKLLNSAPTIDGLISTPIELEQWIDNNFENIHPKKKIIVTNFYK